MYVNNIFINFHYKNGRLVARFLVEVRLTYCFQKNSHDLKRALDTATQKRKTNF